MIFEVIRTQDEPQNHVFPYVYASYSVLITVLTFPRNVLLGEELQLVGSSCSMRNPSSLRLTWRERGH